LQPHSTAVGVDVDGGRVMLRLGGLALALPGSQLLRWGYWRRSRGPEAGRVARTIGVESGVAT
jgi:hypothetical protein